MIEILKPQTTLNLKSREELDKWVIAPYPKKAIKKNVGAKPMSTILNMITLIAKNIFHFSSH